MNRRSILVVAGCVWLMAGVTLAADDTKPNEIEGNWTITSLTYDGNMVDLAQAQVVAAATITKDKFQAGGKTTAGYTISPDGMPKFIDLRIGEEPEKADVSEGIYRLDDDTLTICIRPAGGVKERPSEFEAQAGSGRVLVVLKKAK